MDRILPFADSSATGNLIASLLAMVAVAAAYRLIAARIRRIDWHSAEVGRRWVVMARNVAILAAIFALFVIWAAQLRTLALSMVGFAVAIGLITKELAMCLTGGVLRTGSGMFDIGHRIEVRGLRGDVVDMKMLTTTILEIGPGHASQMHTGRALVLPNALFLSEPLLNESHTRDYALHTATVPLPAGADWRRAERHMLAAAAEVCGEFLEVAGNHIRRIARREGIDPPAVEPMVTVSLSEPGRIDLVLRFPAPSRRKGETEQAVLRRYLDLEAATGD